MREYDVLIVGGGLAGLNAAAEIRERNPELRILLTDASGGASSEIMGFSAPANPPDSPEIFYRDTLLAGGGYSDEALVRVLADRALPELERLIGLGLPFDRTPDGRFDMVNAVGSTHPRVVHSGTTTGRQAMRLLQTGTESSRITGLSVDENGICGAWNEQGEFLHCKAVVLAGGGFAGLWKFSTWSKNLRGDPALLAMGAGAETRDLGFVQFEPTVTVYPARLRGFPVITTVLHEGARLRNGRGDSLLIPGEPVPRKRELAERILREIQAGRSGPHGGIFYDFREVDEDSFARKYPEYHARFQRLSPNFSDLCFEVRPGAHTTLGGIRIGPDCSTRIPGLFAAGEAAGGIHGRDRLGGNAGLEVFVFGRIAGCSAAHYAERHPFSKTVVPAERPLSDPPEFFEQAAALLDRYFHVLSSHAELETGYRETLALPKCPRRDLIRRIFEDALSVAAPSPA